MSWYEEEARRLIQRAERRDESLEDFYRGLAVVRDEIRERIELVFAELPDLAGEIVR